MVLFVVNGNCWCEICVSIWGIHFGKRFCGCCYFSPSYVMLWIVLIFGWTCICLSVMVFVAVWLCFKNRKTLYPLNVNWGGCRCCISYFVCSFEFSWIPGISNPNLISMLCGDVFTHYFSYCVKLRFILWLTFYFLL